MYVALAAAAIALAAAAVALAAAAIAQPAAAIALAATTKPAASIPAAAVHLREHVPQRFQQRRLSLHRQRPLSGRGHRCRGCHVRLWH